MRFGLKSAAWKLGLPVGSGTIGGRKKKSGLLVQGMGNAEVQRLPSEITNDGGASVESVGRVVTPSEQAAAAARESHARRRGSISGSSLIDQSDGPAGGGLGNHCSADVGRQPGAIRDETRRGTQVARRG